jgi:regulator of protease activity HflC (stomatin/prohibitin superfamily)
MGQFLQILLDLAREYVIFWRVVYKGQLGIRWTLGKHVKNLKPGFYFFMPIFQHIETTWACYQEVDTITQTFTTPDEKSVSISANVGYIILDAAKYHTEVYNFDSTVERKIRKVIFATLHGMEYTEIRSRLPALSKEIERTLDEAAQGWGVRIIEAGLTDFVSAPAYRILNEVSNILFTSQ